MTDRTNPPLVADERETLEGFLEFHRGTLEWKCEGLSHEQLRTRSVATSDMSLLGLVRHMGEVERHWFRRVLGADLQPFRYWSETHEGDWDVDDANIAEGFAYWRDECANSRKVLASVTLDHLGTHPTNPARGPFSARWVLTHMIEEYARHNGHADLLREAIDGAVGE